MLLYVQCLRKMEAEIDRLWGEGKEWGMHGYTYAGLH